MTKYTYTLSHDSDCEQPFQDDSSVRLVVLHRRYVDPSNGACGTTPEAVEAWVRRNRRSWHILPLWLYDHSGTVYQAGESNPFSCPWDSGRVGIVALRKREWKGDPSEAMRSVCEAYTAWANGDCWSYTIEDGDGETVDSLCGLVGSDYAEEAAREALERVLASAT